MSVVFAELSCQIFTRRQTQKKYSDSISILYSIKNPVTGKAVPMISEKHYDIVIKNKDKVGAAVLYDGDFQYQYFGFKTLERSDLLKMDGKVVERPQQMLMRVTVGIQGEDIDTAIEMYVLLLHKLFTRVSPTLFFAATPRPQLRSYFLTEFLTMTR